MYFDRYDICEAYNLLAHDYGLYDVKTRLDNFGFKCSHSAEFYDGLTENGKEIYDHHSELLDAGNSKIRSRFTKYVKQIQNCSEKLRGFCPLFSHYF